MKTSKLVHILRLRESDCSSILYLLSMGSNALCLQRENTSVSVVVCLSLYKLYVRESVVYKYDKA